MSSCQAKWQSSSQLVSRLARQRAHIHRSKYLVNKKHELCVLNYNFTIYAFLFLPVCILFCDIILYFLSLACFQRCSPIYKTNFRCYKKRAKKSKQKQVLESKAEMRAHNFFSSTLIQTKSLLAYTAFAAIFLCIASICMYVLTFGWLIFELVCVWVVRKWLAHDSQIILLI